MKIYFDKNDIPDRISRKYISDWIKPLYKKSRHGLYGLNSKDLILSKSPRDADGFVLPLTWNYYLERNQDNMAISIIKSYKKWKKPIYTWNTGDFSLKIPKGEFIVFKHDCYNSLLRVNEIPYPVIIRDPLEYLRMSKINILLKQDKPKVGFCGVSELGLLENKLRIGKQKIKQLMKKFNQPYLDNVDIYSSFKLRKKSLMLFSKSIEINTRFIARSKSSIHKNNKDLKLEFLKNIIDTNYTLCVRGSGNFSTRFYETIALGRIPILINTDCSLPLSKAIDWTKHCVIIDEKNLKNSVHILKNFHKNLSEDDFKNLQEKNRNLWMNKLTFNGFLNSFHTHEN